MRGWFVENMAEMAAVDEMEGMSDRAAALVVASLVDARLTAALQAVLYDDKKVMDDFFRSSGPLGSFSAKIDMALLIGRISPDAYCDLTTMRKIRNAFAHDLTAATFETMQIRDLAANFTLIEKQMVDFDAEEHPIGYSFVLKIKGYAEEKATPRGRFMLTGRLFVAGLDNRAREQGRFTDLYNWM